MNTLSRLTIGIVAGAGIVLAAVSNAHDSGGFGPGMMHGMGPAMQSHMMGGTDSMATDKFRGPMGMMMGTMMAGGKQDKAFAADMSLVHEMIGNHKQISRKVTNLANGIKTVTESDDPKIAQTIKAHVASMEQRLKDGRVFNLFSKTLPVLFKNKDKIKTTVKTTKKGVIVMQTSDDREVIAALQTHAVEVSELAREGMVAMMRGMRAKMAMMDHNSNHVPPFTGSAQ